MYCKFYDNIFLSVKIFLSLVWFHIAIFTLYFTLKIKQSCSFKNLHTV